MSSMKRMEGSGDKHAFPKTTTSIDRHFISGVNDIKRVVHDTLYHFHTLFLFTNDTMIDTVIPGTFFGVLTALSGPSLNLLPQGTLAVLQSIPRIFLWLWLMALQFNVQNQRSATSVEEDAINKPWRPLPAGRITTTQTNHLLLAAHLVTGCVSFYMDVLPMYIAWVILITAYNDWGVSDYSGIVRNVFYGAGFTCLFSGALSIALGSDTPVSRTAWQWTLLFTFGIVGMTCQVQEFRDEAGDRARGRHTIVIALGRQYALWTVAATVAFWSVYAPLIFLCARWKVVVVSVAVGALLVGTAMAGLKDQKFDRQMYRLWSVWVCSLVGLPLLATTFP